MLSLIVALPAVATEYRLFFTRELEHGIPGAPRDGAFACTDTVYAVLEVYRPTPGQHRFSADWIDPGGRIRETARFDFDTDGASTQVWSWLRMHGAPGSALGRLVDPSMGMQEFIGSWRVRIRVDGREVAEDGFPVLC